MGITSFLSRGGRTIPLLELEDELQPPQAIELALAGAGLALSEAASGEFVRGVFQGAASEDAQWSKRCAFCLTRAVLGEWWRLAPPPSAGLSAGDSNFTLTGLSRAPRDVWFLSQGEAIVVILQYGDDAGLSNPILSPDELCEFSVAPNEGLGGGSFPSLLGVEFRDPGQADSPLRLLSEDDDGGLGVVVSLETDSDGEIVTIADAVFNLFSAPASLLGCALGPGALGSEIVAPFAMTRFAFASDGVTELPVARFVGEVV